jgi:hypothetical protein
MDVEILTSKKRLTKSIVNQMQYIRFDELKTAKLLGYVNNLDKNTSRMLLFVTEEGEYKKAFWDWQVSGNFHVIRPNGRYTMECKFSTTHYRDMFYNMIQEAKNNAKQIYL